MEDEELDISWIQEQEQLLNADNYQISPLYQIPIHIVYVNKQDMVEKKETTLHTLTDTTLSHAVLTLLQQQYGRVSYECVDIVYYHFDIAPDKIQDYVVSSQNSYFKTYVGENGITFSPIIKLFHTFSAIYMFFREMKTAPPPPPPKPILKIGNACIGNTKKVRIASTDVPPPPTTSNRQKRIQIVGRKTRKRIVISP